ncbi:MAG: IS630 family transposase [Planctomycetes bacterium]|nr:IS630 family transposase [Planctomycetota bacterium]
MNGSIQLKPKERKVLLECYRKSTDPAVRLRSHILLLLASRYPWSQITAMLFTSPRTISRWKKRFERDGVDAVQGASRGRPTVLVVWWVAVVTRWVLEKTPCDFGFLRSRWSCTTLVLLLGEQHHISISTESVRRHLRRANLVWRRPRPVLGPKDPDYQPKLRRIRRLLANLPEDETVVFQDEVDINTNPKIGSMWMPRGDQAEVETPGNNTKRYLAGSLHWRTGRLFVSEPGSQRNSVLFVQHLHDLRSWLRKYRHIHVVCDNARFHDCRLVDEFLNRWGHRITIHFIPKYAPETNPIERVWWHLHEEITRNHRCQTIEELVELVFQWFRYKETFEIETSVYPQALAA